MKTITRVIPVTTAKVTMANLAENSMYEYTAQLVGKYSSEKKLLYELRAALDDEHDRVVRVIDYHVSYVKATMTLNCFYQYSNHVESTEPPAGSE